MRKLGYLKINEDCLIKNGFVKENDNYVLEEKLDDENFKIIVNIGKDSFTKLIDLESNLEYSLVDVLESNGSFVGRIRKKYENKIKEIVDKCVSNQLLLVISYIKEKYNDELEYLWDNLPDCAIWRHKENNKWYGLIMNINKNKLTNGSKMVDILNVKLPKDQIVLLLERPNFYPAYHMNKKNWLTIILDDSLSDEEIMTYLKISHQFTENIH